MITTIAVIGVTVVIVLGIPVMGVFCGEFGLLSPPATRR
jgi:hypothetical protein